MSSQPNFHSRIIHNCLGWTCSEKDKEAMDRHKRPWNPEVHKILLSREVVANQDPERPMEANIGTIDA